MYNVKAWYFGGTQHKRKKEPTKIERDIYTYSNNVSITHLKNCFAAVVKGYLSFDDETIETLRKRNAYSYSQLSTPMGDQFIRALRENIMQQLNFTKPFFFPYDEFRYSHKIVVKKESQQNMHRDGNSLNKSKYDYNIIIHFGKTPQTSTAFSADEECVHDVNYDAWYKDDDMRCGDFTIHDYSSSCHAVPLQKFIGNRTIGVFNIRFKEPTSMDEIVEMLRANAINKNYRENEKYEEDSEEDYNDVSNDYL
jgi:hypothetical protein